MHTVSEIEEKIRRRYHQPKGVEQFGIEPVPLELKTVRWLDIFAIIFGFALNPGSILVGGLAVVSGLSFLGAVGAITGGVLLATVAYTIMATVGVDFGVPGQVSTRMAFGIRGAKWVPSLLRTFASTYWFAFQTVAGSLAVVAILDRWTGTRHSLVVVSLTFAVLQAVVAIIGYDSLKHLSRLALPFKIVILSLVLGLLATHNDPHFAPAQVFHYAGKPQAGWLLFVTWLNVTAAGSLTMVTDSADFCRYTRSRRDMWWGTLLGKVGGGCFAALLGAYGAAATLGHNPNSFAIASGLGVSHFTLLLFLIVIALDNWTINVLNLYTGGLSLSNMFERLGRFWTTVIISILGIALSATPSVVTGYTALCRHAGQRVLADRRGAARRLYFRQADADRPGGAVRAQWPLLVLARGQPDRRRVDGARFSRLYVRDPGGGDPGAGHLGGDRCRLLGDDRAACPAPGRARPGGAAGPRPRGGRRPRLGTGRALRSSLAGRHDGARHRAPEKMRRPIRPAAISSSEQIRPRLVLSRKKAMPTSAVPAVPMPTKVA